MPRFAISDIHGCAKTFKKILHRISLSKEDKLYLLGDYIDRGPDSRGVIDHIWDLKEKGYQVHCLRGNHEQMLLDAYAGDTSNSIILHETLVSFNTTSVKLIPKPYIKWVKDLPYYFKLEDHILVHAGLNFHADAPFEDKKEMLWIRYWYMHIDRQFLGNRIIVHGHTPTHQLEIKKSIHRLGDIPAINIDAGCVFQKNGLEHLCALNLDTKKLVFEANIDFSLNP